MTRRAIPLADALALAGAATRTRWARLGLAGLLAGAVAWAALLAFGLRPPTTAYLPQGTNGVVVLDVSASISSDTYARITATLRKIAASRGNYGLILFSDVAYQALPPGTPAREFAPYIRFFDIGGPDAKGGSLADLPKSPFTDTFSAGTRISTGLSLALDTIRQQQMVKPAVLLISDLDDETGDLERVTNLAIEYRRAGIPLYVVGLNPSPEDEAFMRRVVPPNGQFTTASLPGGGDARSRAPLPVGLIALAAAAALLAAGLLVASERLRWRPRGAA